MNQEADAEDNDTHGHRERRFVWEFSFSLTCAILVVGVIAFLRYPVSETTLVTGLPKNYSAPRSSRHPACVAI